MWYRYHLATSDFLLWGTDTGLLGTSTTWLLLISCFGVPVPVCLVPVPVCLVPVPLPLQMFPNTIALPKISQQRLPSSAMIHIRSLDTNPYNNYARNPKNLHNSKNTRTIKGTYSYKKMRAKYEMKVLKSDINVALLCIQHTPQPTFC